ncbi:MAG TPA: dienelactone hydrolase family protein [Azospirillaceae bacterium]|nr:dienelactone hydrolase family protein [Azospirillaceae bacterium]
MTDVTIQAKDGGSFYGYLKTPASGSGPGIVVIQEIFGVNKVMRDLVDYYAEHGYVALCPDLFWRQEPGIQLTDQSDAEWQRAFQLYQGFSEAKGVEDLIASVDFLRGYQGVTGKVGTVGFCLGGKLAYLMATRSDADANVSYYGVGIEKDLAEATAISKPLLMHIAEKDKFVPPEAQAQIRTALANNPNVTMHVYEGQDHAFSRKGGAHYHQPSAEMAHARSQEFFARNLK